MVFICAVASLSLGACSSQPEWFDEIFGEKTKQMIPTNRRVPVLNPGGYYGPALPLYRRVPAPMTAPYGAPPPSGSPAYAAPPPPLPGVRSPPQPKEGNWFERNAKEVGDWFSTKPEEEVSPFDRPEYSLPPPRDGAFNSRAPEAFQLAQASFPELNSVPKKPAVLDRVKAGHHDQRKELEAGFAKQQALKQSLDADPEPGILLKQYQGGIPAPQKIEDIDRPAVVPTGPESAPVPSAPLSALPLELASARLPAYTLG